MGRVEACRICLITDVKMARIEGSLETNLKSVFGQNVLFSSDMPDYSCYECTALITKFSKFRKKYFTAQSLLFNILQNHGVITEKEIKKIDREASKLNSNMSTNVTNCLQLVTNIKIEIDPIENLSDDDPIEEMNDSGSDDDVPLNSAKQIEHVNVSSLNKKRHTSKIQNHMNNGNDSREKCNKLRKLQEDNASNESLLKDLTERADANGVVYLQADDFDNEQPDMDNSIQEYNSPEISLKILENQNLMLTNQNSIMSTLANFSARFQSISKTDMMTRARANYNLSPRVDPVSSIIDNKKQLDELENDLNDPEKRQALCDKYGILFNGRAIGYNCAYILVDALFSRKFMTQCSWAGGSRGEDSKTAFRAYKNILSFFHEVIHSCDQNYSVSDCHAFFKNILRNSLKRCKSKQQRMSTHRNRRKAADIIRAKELLGLGET